MSEPQLLELVETLRSQFVEPYPDAKALQTINTKTSFANTDILQEVIKLSKLIKSHATKIGIVCEPTKISNSSNYPAISKELTDFTNSLFYLLSLLPIFHHDKKEEYTQLLVSKLDACILQLLNSVRELCNQLEQFLNSSDENSTDRLTPIGMIWAACDSLDELAKKGNLGLLHDAIRMSCSLVDDVLNDIKGWLEEPHLGNDFLSDGTEDTDEENEPMPKEEEAIERIKQFLIEWQNNLKMIKLLLSSFAKSINNDKTSHNNKSSNLNKLQLLHLAITEKVDELVSDVFMSEADFQETDTDEIVQDLNDKLKQMVSIIKKINKSDNIKSKWIQVWETKYFENNNK